MSRLRFSVASALAAGLLYVAAAAASQWMGPGFPHEKHEKLFPVCEGCHAGVVTGDSSTLYPAAADCANCHDGTRVKKIEWSGPTERVSNLEFSHITHRSVTDTMTSPPGGTTTCQSCHATTAAGRRMDVGAPQPTLCVGCHINEAGHHLASTATCSTCHVPLARAAALPAARIANFPRPPWHDSASFALEHGRDSSRLTTCTVCHTRDTCERCHANSGRVAPIAALARDARVASLERGRSPAYPTPPSHLDSAWRSAHGADARRLGTSSCANCHTRPSCAACHLDGAGRAGGAIAALPMPIAGGAPGVSADSIAADIHPPDIASRHGTFAATGALKCVECHSAQTCSSCHVGSESRAFHRANFVERHATDVFAATTNCQSCHSTERFCRDCHVRAGTAATSRMDAAFHSGQPMWVLSHGQAARRGMESCAACHQQSDCVRCHSASAGWGVNPHGPGFPASRLAARNAASCRWCHTSGFGRGGGE
jgi:predicted CXXCH cytochrome family protein